MTLTQKETGLLKELREQEKLCMDKYTKYSQSACSTELKNLFSEIAGCEKKHFDTVSSMIGGTAPQIPSGGLTGENNRWCKNVGYADRRSEEIDKFLLMDCLAMEKHVSSLYDISVFEFSDTNMRKALNHIQAEEQQHGEKLYAYMNANGMYQS